MLKGSIPCCKSELDLFSTYPTNTSILESKVSEINTTTILSNSAATNLLIFEVKGTPDYLNMAETKLYMNLALRKNDNTKIGKNKLLGVINNFGHSLIKRADLEILNGIQTIELETNHHYAYKAYMLDTLNYGLDSKETWMESAIYEKDVAGEMENFKTTTVKNEQMDTDTVVTQKVNKGFLERRDFFDDEWETEIIIPLHLDFFKTGKFLKNNFDLNIKIELNDGKFCLKGEDAKDVEIIILEAKLIINHCRINTDVQLAHIKALDSGNIKYPIKPVRVDAHLIHAGLFSYELTMNNSIILPDLLLIGLVEHKAFTGDILKNPYNFQHFNLKTLQVHVNSNCHIIKTNFKNNKYLKAYDKLMTLLDMNSSKGNNIQRRDFKDGYAIFAIDLRPVKCVEDVNPITTGKIQILFEFENQTPSQIQAIIVSQYQNQFEIDKKNSIEPNFKLI